MSTEKCPECGKGPLLYTWVNGCLRLVCHTCGVVLRPDYTPVEEKPAKAS